jgi:hypothetical protein
MTPYYNTQMTTLGFDITPSYLGISNITYAYAGNGTFNVTIPASEQAKFPAEQYVNIIFYVYWSNNGTVDISYTNIAYRVKFSYYIQPVI